MLSLALRGKPARTTLRQSVRSISTLQSNPSIYIFPDPGSPVNSYILTLLPTSPPSRNLCIGITSKIPPNPDSLTENPRFHSILRAILAQYAHLDPGLRSQATAFASSSAFPLESASMFLQRPQDRKRGTRRGGGDGAGGASSQGGAGGGGRGGWVHLSDGRAPPYYGRIASPEDIFGSLEVDGQGELVVGDDGKVGNWQESGTYRVITREGILGLSNFLREKLVQRLREEELMNTSR